VGGARPVAPLEIDNFAGSVALDGAGHVVVSGSVRRHADFDPGPGQYIVDTTAGDVHSPYLWKLDSDGNFVSAKVYNVNGFGGSLTRDSGGNIYMCGAYFA